jgi:hypothetical protein
MSVAQVAALTAPSVCLGLTLAHIAAMQNSTAGLSKACVRDIPAVSMGGMNAAGIATMTPKAFGTLSRAQVELLPPSSALGVTSEQLSALSEAPAAVVRAVDAAAEPSAAHACAGFTAEFLSLIPPTTISQGLLPQCAASLSGSCSGFTADQARVLQTAALAALTTACTTQIAAEDFAAFAVGQVAALLGTKGAYCAKLSSAQAAALTDAAAAGIAPECIHKMECTTIAALLSAGWVFFLLFSFSKLFIYFYPPPRTPQPRWAGRQNDRRDANGAR